MQSAECRVNESFVGVDVAERRERNEKQPFWLLERQVAIGNFCDTSRNENLDDPKKRAHIAHKGGRPNGRRQAAKRLQAISSPLR